MDQLGNIGAPVLRCLFDFPLSSCCLLVFSLPTCGFFVAEGQEKWVHFSPFISLGTCVRTLKGPTICRIYGDPDLVLTMLKYGKDPLLENS